MKKRSERRSDPRVDFPLAIAYRPIGEFLGMWSEGTVADLGVGGLRLTSSQPLEQEMRVEVRILLPSRQEPCFVTGRIIWRTETTPSRWEHGMAFVDVTAEKRVELDSLVRFLRRV